VTEHTILTSHEWVTLVPINPLTTTWTVCSTLPYDDKSSITMYRTDWSSTATIVSTVDCESPRSHQLPGTVPNSGNPVPRSIKPNLSGQKEDDTGHDAVELSGHLPASVAADPSPTQTTRRTTTYVSRYWTYAQYPSTKLVVQCSSTTTAAVATASSSMPS
jgi:hypothetical protein